MSQTEETLGVATPTPPVAEIGRPIDEPRIGKPAKKYRIYHPRGFALTVVGEKRRDVLLGRGYSLTQPAASKPKKAR